MFNYCMNGKKRLTKNQRASDDKLLENDDMRDQGQIINISDLITSIQDNDPTKVIDSKIARTIFFDQEISEDSATMLRAQLMSLAAEDQKTPIRLMLGTPGGGLWESFAIFDTIRLLPCPVIAICTGKVMSGGIIMLLACDHRVSTQNTTFMIHHGHTVITGNPIQLKDQLNEIEVLNNRMLDMIIKETNITREQLNLWLAKDYYLDVENARQIGLIDEIITKLSDLDMYYCDEEVVDEDDFVTP